MWVERNCFGGFLGIITGDPSYVIYIVVVGRQGTKEGRNEGEKGKGWRRKGEKVAGESEGRDRTWDGAGMKGLRAWKGREIGLPGVWFRTGLSGFGANWTQIYRYIHMYTDPDPQLFALAQSLETGQECGFYDVPTWQP